MPTISIHAIKAIIATVLLGLCLQANAGERATGRVEGTSQDRAEAELRRVLSYELADVKSRRALALHLRRAGNDSPLNALSPAARERFLDSLAFNEKGLTGYRYDDMQRELTVTQAYRILRLFGAGESAPFLHAMRTKDALDAAIQSFMNIEDHEGARCIERGTCELHYPNHICTSNC